MSNVKKSYEDKLLDMEERPTESIVTWSMLYQALDQSHRRATYEMIGLLCEYVYRARESTEIQEELYSQSFWRSPKVKLDTKKFTLAATRFVVGATKTGTPLYERARKWAGAVDYYLEENVDPADVPGRLDEDTIEGAFAKSRSRNSVEDRATKSATTVEDELRLQRPMFPLTPKRKSSPIEARPKRRGREDAAQSGLGTDAREADGKDMPMVAGGGVDRTMVLVSVGPLIRRFEALEEEEEMAVVLCRQPDRDGRICFTARIDRSIDESRHSTPRRRRPLPEAALSEPAVGGRRSPTRRVERRTKR